VISGTPIRRPYGQQQIHPTDAKQGSKYGPCRLMDIELEVGWFVGTANELGMPVPIEDAADAIFGCGEFFVLFSIADFILFFHLHI